MACSAPNSLERSSSPTRMIYQSEKQPRFALERMNQLRKGGELCDVVLLAGRKRIGAHRLILAACSGYFHAMFTSEMAECRKQEILIQDIDELAFESLIDFCYTSHIAIEEQNVQCLLPAACLLQLQEIQDVCCEFLKKQLDPSNCLGIRAFADTHSCRDLLRMANKYAQQHFVDVVESDEFLMLPLSQLVDIVASEELNVRSEEQVFNAVMSWVRHDVQDRRTSLAKLSTISDTATRPIAFGKSEIPSRSSQQRRPDQNRLGMPRFGR